jgi:uncharacterized protein YjbI with pentapeptide repeats
MTEGRGTPTPKQQKEPDKRPPWGKRLWEWTEFGKKSGWNWLELLSALAIPVVLAVAGLYIEAQLDERQRKSDARRAQTEHQLEERRADDAALQAYLDQIGTLMLNKNLLESEPGDSAYTLAQARTSTAISRLDADHNRHVTRFLSDSGLSGQAGGESSISLFRKIDLSGADLSGADLSAADLSGATLNNVTLTDARLARADLRDAKLNKANLSYAFVFEARLRNAVVLAADLRHTDLSYSDLSGANLSSWANLIESTAKDEEERNKMKRIGANVVGAGNLSEAADLSGADLSAADLRRADLRDAVLIDANLSGARVSKEQLDQAYSLEGATMPNGQKYEDWLKSRGKDRENSGS